MKSCRKSVDLLIKKLWKIILLQSTQWVKWKEIYFMLWAPSGVFFMTFLGFPGSTGCKEPACQCRRNETQVQSLGGKGPLEEGMQATPIFLLGESHRQWSLVGYKSIGSQRIRHSWRDLQEWVSSHSVCTPWCHSWTKFDQTRGKPQTQAGPSRSHLWSCGIHAKRSSRTISPMAGVITCEFGSCRRLWFVQPFVLSSWESPSSEKITETAHEQQRKGARKRSSIPQVPWSFLLPTSFHSWLSSMWFIHEIGFPESPLHLEMNFSLSWIQLVSAAC